MKEKKIIFILFTIILTFIVAFSTFNKTINSVSLYFLIPILFIYVVIKSIRVLKFKPIILLFLFFIWMGVTGIVATNSELYFSVMRKMLSVVLFCSVVVGLILIDRRYLSVFYVLFSFKFILIFIYAYNNGLTNTDSSLTRFGLEELNANMFGYFGFFAVMSIYFLRIIISHKKINKLLIVFLALMYSLGLLSSYFAASRASTIILLLSLVVFLSIDYFYPFNYKSIILIIFSIIILFFIQDIVPDKIAQSDDIVLVKRFQAIEDDSRIELIKKGIQVGLNNPITGVGSGQFMNYSEVGTHSSYAEVFATNGLVGLFLYLFLLIEPLIKSYRMFSNKILAKKSLYFMFFFLIYLIYNIFYWFHLNMFLLGFFFIARMHLELLYRSQNLIRLKNLLNLALHENRYHRRRPS